MILFRTGTLYEILYKTLYMFQKFEQLNNLHCICLVFSIVYPYLLLFNRSHIYAVLDKNLI